MSVGWFGGIVTAATSNPSLSRICQHIIVSTIATWHLYDSEQPQADTASWRPNYQTTEPDKLSGIHCSLEIPFYFFRTKYKTSHAIIQIGFKLATTLP